MLTEKGTKTVMLMTHSAVSLLHTYGDASVDMEAWDKKGLLRLKESFVQELAEAAARNVGGTLIKHWFNEDAGGYFAEIDVR